MRLPTYAVATVAAAAALSLAVPATTASSAARTSAAAVPSLTVTTLASGLDIPWDVKSIGGGRLLITERTTRKLKLWDNGTVRTLDFPSETVWASSASPETGLMGLAVDPSFSSNRRFYTCSGGFRGGDVHDVRVRAWTLNSAATTAYFQRTLLSGIPATTGRHGGCRLLITSYGALVVGTGDAATGTNPQNLYSLGGKTLRLNRFTGAPWPSNPFIRSRSSAARYVVTYGHRNVQGLAQRADGTIWSVEHGPDRDDEVNLLHAGGNYGWNPVPGYNEDVPMTDFGLPGPQYGAKWRSGSPTLATSGAAWVYGSHWGDIDGSLAVAALKASRLTFLKFTSAGRLVSVRVPSALRGYGRLRGVTRLGDGDLLVTTSNSTGSDHNDKILRVHPHF